MLAAQAGQVDVAYTVRYLFRTSSVEGYSLARLAKAWTTGALTCPPSPRGHQRERRSRRQRRHQRSCAVRRAINLRRGPAGDDRQRAERLRQPRLQRLRPDALVQPRLRRWTTTRRAPPPCWTRPAGSWGGRRPGEGRRSRRSCTLLYSTGDSVRQALAADFASQMEELGIDLLH